MKLQILCWIYFSFWFLLCRGWLPSGEVYQCTDPVPFYCCRSAQDYLKWSLPLFFRCLVVLHTDIDTVPRLIRMNQSIQSHQGWSNLSSDWRDGTYCLDARSQFYWLTGLSLYSLTALNRMFCCQVITTLFVFLTNGLNYNLCRCSFYGYLKRKHNIPFLPPSNLCLNLPWLLACQVQNVQICQEFSSTVSPAF